MTPVKKEIWMDLSSSVWWNISEEMEESVYDKIIVIRRKFNFLSEMATKINDIEQGIMDLV